MKRPYLCLTVLVLTIALLSGCEKKCEVPAGTYKMKMSAIEGNCLDNIWKPFEGHGDTLEVEKGRECRDFLTTRSEKLSENCSMTVELSATQNQDGLSDGRSVIRVKCEDDYQCRHLFNVEYTRVSKP